MTQDKNRRQAALDQRALKTLAIWIVWASICITVLMQLYQMADIWTYIQHDESHITWAIVGIFLLGVVLSLIHVLLLTREWFSAYRLVASLARHGLHGVRRIRGVVCSRFISALQHIEQTGGGVDFSDLSTLEFAGHIRASHWVSLLGSLLITLGLIGTVLGLTITLSGLDGALENVAADSMSVLIGLREAMSGMGLAFYTTLLGSIMGGVFLRVFARINDDSIEALQDMMVRNCVVYASSDFKRSLQQEFHVVDQVVEGMQARMDALTQSLQQSRAAIAAFAEEIRDLKDSTRLTEHDDEIFKSIAVHRHYAKILRYELSLQKRLANFKQRLSAALGFQSTRNTKDS